MKSLSIIILGFYLCYGHCLWAQESIKHRLINSFGTAVTDATIHLQKQKSISNQEGYFQLNPQAGLLKIHAHGFQPLHYKWDGKTQLTLTLLQEDTNRYLPEVGISQQKNGLQSIVHTQKIDGLKLQNSFEANPINTLRGRVAGLQMYGTAGGVTSGSGMVIRGMKSIVGSNQPLFVLDGIPIENESSGANQNGGQDWGNKLKELNAFDIAEITVLKSAAATAHYGARGLNGVIEIKSKGADIPKGWSVETNIGHAMGQAYMAPQLIRGDQVVGIQDPRLAYLSNASSNYLNSFEQANSQLVHLSLNYGLEKFKYRLSYTGDWNKGTYVNNTFDKHNILFKSLQEWSPKLKSQAGIYFTSATAVNAPSIGAQRFSSIGRSFIEYPVNFGSENLKDPLSSRTAWYMYGHHARKNSETYRAFAKINWSPTSKLSVEAETNYSNYQIKTREFANGYFERLFGQQSLYHQELGYRNQAQEYSYDFVARANVKYHILKGYHNLTGAIHYDYWRTQGGIHGNSRRPLNPNAILLDNGNERKSILQYLGDENFTEISSMRIQGANNKQINGIAGSVNYRYGPNFTAYGQVKYDNVKTLETLDKLGNLNFIYPTLGVGYQFNDIIYKLISPSKNWLNQAKIHANFGRTGNVTGLFHYQSSVTDDLELPYPNFNSLYTPYYTATGNWGLRDYQTGFAFENAYEFEVGTTFDLFNNRLHFAATYYHRLTDNKLFDIIAPLNQYSKPLRQVDVQVRNQGVEFIADFTAIQKRDWDWNIFLQFSSNNNKFTRIKSSSDINLGDAQQDVSLMATAQGSFGTITTNYAHKYHEGQPVFDAAMQYSPSGVPQVIGNALPKWLGGIENSVRFKHFTLSALLDIKLGGDIWSGTYALLYQRGALENTLFGRSEQHGGILRQTAIPQVDPATGQPMVTYQNTHDGIAPQGVFDQGITLFGTDVSHLTFAEAQEKIGLDDQGVHRLQPLSASSYYSGFHERAGVRENAIFKNSFIALREISIAYDIPSKGFRKFQVGLVGRNLGYLYKSLPFGLNPDGSYNNRNGGAFEYASLLPVRTFAAFLTLKF